MPDIHVHPHPRLSDDEIYDVVNCIRMAADENDKAAKALRRVARDLRRGQLYPLYAPGEEGARAADYHAEWHEQSAERRREIADYFEDAEQVTIR